MKMLTFKKARSKTKTSEPRITSKRIFIRLLYDVPCVNTRYDEGKKQAVPAGPLNYVRLKNI